MNLVILTLNSILDLRAAIIWPAFYSLVLFIIQITHSPTIYDTNAVTLLDITLTRAPIHSLILCIRYPK